MNQNLAVVFGVVVVITLLVGPTPRVSNALIVRPHSYGLSSLYEDTAKFCRRMKHNWLRQLNFDHRGSAERSNNPSLRRDESITSSFKGDDDEGPEK